MDIKSIMNAANAPPSRAMNLGDIAVADPRLAFTLLQTGRCAGGYVDTGGWETLNLTGRFESGAANETVNGQLNGIVEADLWVKDVTYTVRRPNAFAGSIWKGQSDFFNALNPNIDFTLNIKSFCEYQISPQYTPLENLKISFSCQCPAGLVLRYSARIQATFMSLRALAEDEIPTEAIITLHCWRLPMNMYGSCSTEQARAVLQNLGYLPQLPGIAATDE